MQDSGAGFKVCSQSAKGLDVCVCVCVCVCACVSYLDLLACLLFGYSINPTIKQ